mgnify:FL=1
MVAKRTITVLVTACLLAVLVISLQWTETPPAPPPGSTTDAPPGVMPPEHTAPHQSAPRVNTTPLDDARNRVAGSGVVVRGLILNFDGPRAWLASPTKMLGSAVRDADGSFEHTCDGPLTSLELRAIATNGAERKQLFSRPKSEAWSRWDLGDIDMGGAEVTLEFTLEYDPDVIQRMLACNQTRASVTVVEPSAKSSKLAVVEFDLTALPSSRRSSITKEAVVRTGQPGADLLVTWQCFYVHNILTPSTTARDRQTLAGELGPRRTSSLHLVPEQEVRGQVTNKLGATCPGVSVVLTTQTGDYPKRMSVRTSPEGNYSFHVALNATGTVGLGGTIQYTTDDGQQVPFAAGAIANLRMQVTTAQVRLVDASGQAIHNYRMRSILSGTFAPWQVAEAIHPNGITQTTVEQLAIGRWLCFDVGEKRRQIFMVPANWLDPDDRSVREVSVTRFAPSATIHVTRGSADPIFRGKSRLQFVGKNELVGLQFSIPAPPAGDWLIEDVPVGTFEYSLHKLREIPIEGEIVVTAGRHVALHLTR